MLSAFSFARCSFREKVPFGAKLLSVVALGMTLAACALLPASAQVSVTTYHNDIGRTGQNLNETILTPSNVNTTQFGKLFSQSVDAQIYAQPLYLYGITVNGATHNVIFVATENDSIYAFDADSNIGANASPLWQASMLTAAHGAASGATSIPASDLGSDINPLVGITGTPVIDSASGTLYVVSADLEGGNAVQRLHALDVTTGLEKLGGPVVITASVPGTGNGSVNGTLTFDSYWQNQRGGLLLLNGIIWVGFASHGDNGPWHGWIMGYNENTLQQTGVFCTSPNGTGSGVWGAGAGLAADQLDTVNHPYGRMFIPTGNGDFNATTPYTGAMDYGDSDITLDLTNGVPTVTDDFTTYLQAKLDAGDLDQGSGGMMVIPTQTTGSHPHLAVQAGKEGTLFLLNRDSMGGYSTTADNVVQSQVYTVGDVGVWSTAAYWNGNVYYWGQFDYLKSFALTNGLLSTTPTESTETYGFPGSTPSISANGNTQGIVWSINSNGYTSGAASVLQAHSASNVATTLYSSSTNPTRDTPGPAVKFTVPTVVNGKVYMGTSGELDIYGLLNGANQTATPTFNPGSETFAGSLPVAIADATANSTIYYTTNGTSPNTGSTLYTGPITVSSTETINAIAVATGFLQSAPASATYTNSNQTPPVTFSLPTGSYTSAQTVSLSDSSSNAVIYYTLDGSTPTTSSAVYGSPIVVSATETITAIAAAPGLTVSPAIAATFTITSAANGISYNQGFANSGGITMIFNGSTDLDDTRLQLTSGGTGQAGSAWYYTPVNVQSFTTDFTFQLSNAVANGITFAMQTGSANALGGNAYELGYAPIANSLAIKFDLYNSAGEGSDSTGLYLNGAIPTVPAIDLTSSGINLHSGDTMAIHVTYDGATLTMKITDIVTAAVWSTSWTVNIPSSIGGNTAYVGFTGSTGAYSSSQKILTWSYTSGTGSTTAATPFFSPAGGSYTTAQTVTLSDNTTGATMYYTTNGTTPTSSSTAYTAPITVSSTETINAIAVATGLANSSVSTATYTIAPVLPTPTFLPAGGSYATAQVVTISDTAPGTTIYYTTNGATPTTSSTVYSAPITVSASQTLKAIAVETGYTNSAAGTAAYTISTTVAMPTFSPVAGTYTTAQTVTISDTTTGATIYYTTNGTTPTTASSVYTAPITVSSTETVNALAVATGYSNSAVSTAAYTISSATPVINFASGMSATGMNLYGAKITGTALQITDGGSAETHVAWFNNPVNVQNFTTDFTFQNPSSTAEGFTFAIQNAAAGVWAVGGTSGGLAYSGLPTSVAVKFDLYNNSGEGIDSTGFYTNGAMPTTPFTDMTSSGVNLHSGDILHAHITYNGTTLTLTLTDTVTNASFTTSTAINIPSTVGGNTAYVGFTGTTGSLTAVQNILTWTYLVGAANPTTATPTFSPVAGSYTTAQTVTISDATAGSTIYYTTDGTTPTTSSTVYSAPLTVGSTETINAIATSTGNANSAVATAAYTIAPLAATPTFSPVAGTYTSAQTVTISDTTTGATIYYTTNGTTPTTASTAYSVPITVSATETLKAIAVAVSYTNSAIGSAAYTITGTAATPTFSPVAGTYSTTQTVTISDGTSGATMYYTTNGTTPTTASTAYTAPITVSASETLNAIAVKTGWTNSAIGSAAYTITTPAATPTFTPLAGTYTSGQSVAISDTTTGATIYYTTNGTTPTTASAVYSAPIAVNASETIEAIAVAAGYSNSAVGSAVYTITGTVATPTFSPLAGTYATAQTVTISDTTSSATIYYTTNGTTPTTASTAYTSPITVSASETLNAIAVKTGWTNSAVGTAAYVITPPAATPTFSPVAGSYATAQTVTISDTTTGAKIYYTTNGATPTTSSTLYSTPVTVGATETLNAIAIATNYTTSAVGTAAYTITTPTAATPTFSPVAGTYTSTQTVTISDTTPGSTIYYTTNGTTPTTSSTAYTTPISVSATETLEAIAVAASYNNSAVGTAAYTISAAPPLINFPTTFTSTGLNLYGAKIVSGALQMTDGGSGEQRAAWYATPVNVQTFTTDFTFQDTAATADGMTFTIQNAAAGVWAVGGNGAALGYGGITNSVAVKFDLYNNSGEGSDSTGFYVNGASPTVPSVDMTSSGVNLHSGDSMHAHLTYDGTTLTLTLTDTVTNASFTTATAINIPTTIGANTAYVGFTAGTGGSSATQSVLNWTFY